MLSTDDWRGLFRAVLAYAREDSVASGSAYFCSSCPEEHLFHEILAEQKGVRDALAGAMTSFVLCL